MKRISKVGSSGNSSLPPQPPLPSFQRMKKTRELPNLSNCHCCNRRVNSTNPKNRLRMLCSEWRIVLLCSSCHSLVESSQLCSYCLTNLSSSSPDSFFECVRCHRGIHRNCVSMFDFIPDKGGNFYICFDCWVPNFLENDSSRICESRPSKRARKEGKISGDSTSLESSRVCDSHDKSKSLEETVNDANVVAEKKVDIARTSFARRAVAVVSDFVAVDRGGGSRGSLIVDDDAQLAIKLHRAMNSSPRIARNSCLLNTSPVNVPVVKANANPEALQSQVADKTCLSREINVGCNVSEGFTDSLSRKEESGLSSNETRQDFEQKTCETEDNKSKLAIDLNDCLITYSRKRRMSQGGISKKGTDGLLKMYRRRLSNVERRNTERGYLKTYHRKLSAVSHCKSRLIHGGFHLELGNLDPALAFKCCEEKKSSC